MWKPKFVETGVQKFTEAPQKAITISLLALAIALVTLFAVSHKMKAA